MDSFDYVIVGAGTAGCVVANRLSADGRSSVLVIEAGGSDRRPLISVPIGYARLLFASAINWMYETESDAGLNGRKSFWPRGKVVGGSGSINAMVYMRGLPQDFDGWAALGNAGWSYGEVLPYFMQAEDHDGGDPAFHGRGGPMRVTDVSADAHPLCDRYLKSCEALGFRRTADFNAGTGEGVGIYQINTRRGLRSSSAREYLRPALRRPNLTLRTQAQVSRLVFKARRACGVRYLQDGQSVEVAARRHVILCGGSINSPQLLQLSGIGAAQDLKPLGIEMLVDSQAVGRNLQDHLAVSYFYRSSQPTLNDQFYPLTGKIRAALRYVLTRRGPLAMSVNQGGGFIRSDPTQPAPNLQLYFNPVSYTKTPLADRKLLSPDPFSAFLLSFNSCRPTSRGSLTISSSDPRMAPRIRPNYLSTEHDVAEAIAGCRLLRTMAATPPLADVITGEIHPGPAVTTDAELLQDFRDRADTVFHPVSTCTMGPDPLTAVVDARLRVYGVTNLRVIDASVFPTLTSGNTNAPTVMVAEKGAAMLHRGRARVRLPLRLVLMLSIGLLINYVDRGSISVAAPVLEKELALSAVQMGWVLSAFFWAYVPLQPVMGWLADRIGAARVLAGGFTLWSVATVLDRILERGGRARRAAACHGCRRVGVLSLRREPPRETGRGQAPHASDQCRRVRGRHRSCARHVCRRTDPCALRLADDVHRARPRFAFLAHSVAQSAAS